MAASFGIPQIVDYLAHMGLRIASINQEEETVELAFHASHGQWRMVIGFQHSDEARKLILVVPHISGVTARKRLECLEALMAVNYRITMGKFGLDLDDGEIRLEEAVPLANESISLAQFQLVFGTLMQTVTTYYSLIPRILYGNLTTQEALNACEEEFLQGLETTMPRSEAKEDDVSEPSATPAAQPELNARDILAEISRMLDEKKEQE
ncbi:MAG TPA: YbjN domain-containing protein [Ktedonobacteraceae bacterium]|nr:YbjN domain-containing protein [Ktedonobacteraceae bacterium]